MLSNFLKDDGTNIIFTGNCMEIYVPDSYFERQIASVEGVVVKTFGILPCSVFDANMKELNSYTINLPTTIMLFYKELSIEKRTIQKYTNAEPESCHVLRFFKNDPIMSNIIQQHSSNVSMFFIKLLCTGKLTLIPYDKLLEVWERNLELNSANLGLTATAMEVILSEIYRNKDNPNEKFSIAVSKNPNISMYDYRAANIREICSMSSTFAALTFENMDAMITSSLNMKNYNKKQVESPLEKILKM